MWIGYGMLLVLFATLISSPVQARERDEVMAGAYRCAGIADDRQWLDCYYGVAQPVRAELGLPPASEAQLRLAAAPPVGSPTRNAMTRGETMAGAARCYTISDDRQWLNCYYAAAQPMRAQLALAPATPPPEAPGFSVRRPDPVPSGGFSDWLGGSKDQRIVSRMESYSFDRYNIFTVKLTNGQVWQQNSGDTTYARWKKPASQYIAVLTRGALGSVDLRVQGEARTFKVTRLQ